MNELVQLLGALTSIQLSHTGRRDPCLYSRETPMSVSALPASVGYGSRSDEIRIHQLLPLSDRKADVA